MAAPFGRRRATVVGHEELGPYVVLDVDDRDGGGSAGVSPGQFHMLATVERWGGGEDERPFLPRAIAPMPGPGGALRFVLHDVGPGTHRLEELAVGEELWLTGPLGNGFRGPEDGRRAILLAGGIGVPPVAAWASALRDAGMAFTALAGFRDGEHAALATLLPGARVATDDGSAPEEGPAHRPSAHGPSAQGTVHHGFVTELLADEVGADAHATVYACGPPGMLEAVRALCGERGVPAQLALESPMACGFGACFGCVVPLAGGGYARTCVDGPVMDAAALAEVPV